MTTFVSVLSVLLIVSLVLVQSAPQTGSQRNSPDYSVTHLDIRDAILSLVSVLRDQMDKLERHEVRERQLGEQLTRSLATLEKRGRGEEKNIENIASYLARVDEKVKFAQQTLEKQSEDRRLENERTRSELENLKNLISQNAGGGSQNIERKLDSLAERVNQLREKGDRNAEKFDGLMELWKATSIGTGSSDSSDLNENVMAELTEIKESLSRTLDVESRLLSSKENGGQSEWQTEIVESLDSQRKQLAVLEEEIGKALGLLGDVTKSATTLSGVLSSLDEDTKQGFETLGTRFGSGGQDSPSSSGLDIKLSELQEILQNGQKNLEEKIKETDEGVKKLYVKMESEYKNLAGELKGIANVESVLLDTGDSVLDTKRRLEYGVQQIMGEINHQLSTYTGNLNTSLQQRFDGLATAVLGNQSLALTNLTSRMEEEISQVWRQIGILYHQMSKSAGILDEIHSQTSQYVNNSLDTMSSMDGKVGQITNQMGAVDDNLNYLLGRMSLVVQEFNMIKGGLGDALNDLKEELESQAQLEQKPQLTTPTPPDVENEVSPL